jgi:signal transduction histidine kinase/sugar phosphate isomerase/epimerase
MRFGYQTIIFGRHVKDWERTFGFIADAGFAGVELFQSPSEIVPNRKIDALLELLSRFQLSLIGLAGGTIAERTRFLGDLKEPYLYADRFETAERQALAQGYTVALHPHVFKPIHRLDDAIQFLEDPELNQLPGRLLLLPDTAHFAIVGDDPVDAVVRFRERLAAVHLKAWDSCFGHASYRAFRGLTSLGEGVAKVRECLDRVSTPAFSPDLWVVVEQDFAERSPELEVYGAARTLVQWGKMPSRGYAKLREAEATVDVTMQPVPGGEIELAYRRHLDDLSLKRNDATFSEAIAPLKDLLDPRVVALSAYREGADYLTLLAAFPAADPSESRTSPPPSPRDEDLVNAVAPIVEEIPEQRQSWDRQVPQSFRRYRIPILNTHNHNHVRFVLDFYAPLRWQHAGTAWQLADILGRHLDCALDQRCQRHAGAVAGVAAMNEGYSEFARGLRKLIGAAIECEAVAIFIADPSLTVLRDVGSEEVLEWNPELKISQHFYLRTDTYTDTVKAWVRALPRFCELPSVHEKWKSELCVQDHGTGAKEFLHFPMIDAQGDCIGIVRCGGKLPPIYYFHPNDLAILDSILHVAMPRLLSLRAEDDRRSQIGNITHELKRPIIAIRTAVELIGKEFNERQERFGFPMLDYPWIDDASSWCNLMSHIVTNPDYLRSNVALHIEPVVMVKDVVAPIVRMLSLTLRTHKSLKPRRADGTPSIEYGRFEHLDRRLYLDRLMFQQVIFNLIDNAIKYARPSKPEEFRVRFVTEFRDDAFWIKVQDWGIGIDADVKDPEVLFEDGVRGPRAHLYQAGTGFGLWVVRRLLGLHRCSISVTRRAAATEFSIRIPMVLTRPNWRTEREDSELT